MATGNSDLKSFAVFVNSKSAIENTTAKSEVTIPFIANIAVHEPFKTFKFSLIDVLFTNVFFNVRPGAQILKYINTYAPGRGFTTPQFEIHEVVIPEGFYDYASLSTYLSQAGILGMQVHTSTYFFNIYKGFGATESSVSSTAAVIDAAVPALAQGKILFNTPTLGDYYQDNVGITSNYAGWTAPYSYIYSGVYLVEDQSTYRMLRMLGITNDSTIPSPIPGTTYSGFGFKIYSKETTSLTTNTSYSFDNVTFVSDPLLANTTHKTLVPSTIADLSGLDEIYIHCPQFRTQFQSSYSKQPIGPNDVIAVIPVSVPFGTKMQWSPQFPLHAYLLNTNVQQLEFRMTNSNNELLNFNGIDWSMTLFCEEEIDESRLELENGGTFNNPLQINANLNAGSQMEERGNRLKRGRLNNNRK